MMAVKMQHKQESTFSDKTVSLSSISVMLGRSVGSCKDGKSNEFAIQSQDIPGTYAKIINSYSRLILLSSFPGLGIGSLVFVQIAIFDKKEHIALSALFKRAICSRCIF